MNESTARWSATLDAVAREPLEMCPPFPKIAARFERWWECRETDRPILIGSTNKNPERKMTRRIELVDEPDQWFQTKQDDLQQTLFMGDAIPNIRVDFGAAMLGSLLGGKAEVSGDTTWTHSFLNDDWSNAPDWKLVADHPWRDRLEELLVRTARDARGRYVVCTPNMGGAVDVLLNFRGATELCMDALDHPETIKSAAEAIYPAYREVQALLYEKITGEGAGLLHWHQLWSGVPYTISECDFSFMLGPDEYEEICVPDIERLAQTFSRSIFHLDGPGSARHIDRLLEIPSVHAVQYTPGEGTPSALNWLDMFRKIQAAGRALLIFSPTNEVLQLCKSLDPKGLAISLPNPPPAAELTDLWERFQQRYPGADE